MGWKAEVFAGSRNAANEFEELRRAQDRIGDARLLNQLRAQIAAVGGAIGPKDRQRNMVSYASPCFRREKIGPRRLEELQNGRVVE